MSTEKPGLTASGTESQAPAEWVGDPSDAAGRYAVIVSRYNESITEKLLQGALSTLQRHGIDASQIDVIRVPGAWELPVAARRMVDGKKVDAVLCLGCVIRGETSHDEHINRQVSLALGEMACQARMPVLFGLLTCHSLEQAIQRSGGRVGNKGEECAMAALEMVSLLNRLP